MKKEITVTDPYQKKYTYEITELVGKNFHPDFVPHLTPQKMLATGVFDGVYFGDKPKEFPKEWFTKAKLAKNHKRDKSLNYFDVSASKSLEYWREKGWIHPDDPRG